MRRNGNSCLADLNEINIGEIHRIFKFNPLEVCIPSAVEYRNICDFFHADCIEHGDGRERFHSFGELHSERCDVAADVFAGIQCHSEVPAFFSLIDRKRPEIIGVTGFIIRMEEGSVKLRNLVCGQDVFRPCGINAPRCLRIVRICQCRTLGAYDTVVAQNFV